MAAALLGEVFYTPVHRNKTNLTAEDIAVLLDLSWIDESVFLIHKFPRKGYVKKINKSALPRYRNALRLNSTSMY